MSSTVIGKVIRHPPAKPKIVVIGLQDKSFQDSRMSVLPFYDGITEALMVDRLHGIRFTSFCYRFAPFTKHDPDLRVDTLLYA